MSGAGLVELPAEDLPLQGSSELRAEAEPGSLGEGKGARKGETGKEVRASHIPRYLPYCTLHALSGSNSLYIPLLLLLSDTSHNLLLLCIFITWYYILHLHE